MISFNDQLEFSSRAHEALQRIKSKNNEKTTSELLHETRMNLDYSRMVFEEYSDEKFSKKIELDSNVYNQFLKSASEDTSQYVQEILSSYLGTIRAIYEHINIEPKIYGFVKMDKHSSNNELLNESRRIIFEHLDKHYYNLSSDERQKKYKSFVVGISHDITINENIDIDESVEHTYKSAVITKLLENINFPFTVKSKIEELLESQIYKEVYDVDTLEKLWEDFHEQTFSLSRVLSLLC